MHTVHCTVFTLCTFQRQTILPCLIFIIQLGQSEMITKSEQYHVEVGDQGIVYYILPSIVKKRYFLKLAINSRCLECRCWLLHNWSQEGEEEGMREEEEVDRVRKTSSAWQHCCPESFCNNPEVFAVR